MMKINKRHILFSLLALISFAGSIAASIAWFEDLSTNVTFGNGSDTFIKGGTEKGLYGSGDGSSDDPWVINTPGQLYNLAWAYYLGRYDDQYNYFKLGVTNLDMTGYTLPPIGTEDHPFVASFDGDGNTISNLTVSNTFADYGNAHPTQVTSASFSQSIPEVVGFFGAIGPIITNTHYSNYSGTAASLTDLTLNNLKVKSATSKTLIGLVAGYVDGTMSGVKVSGNNTSITVSNSGVANFDDNITTKLSDYSLVGYSKNPADERVYNQNISAFYDADNNTTGMEADWGGSVDMLSLFERIYNFKYFGSGGERTPYDYNIGDVEYSLEDDKVVTYTTNAYTNTYQYNFDQNSDHLQMGNYNVFEQQDANMPRQRMYLGGGHWERSSRTYESYINYSGYYISKGSNYLTYKGSISNVDVDKHSSVWNLSTTTETTTIYTYYHGTIYYLVNNSGTLGVSTTPSSSSNWTISSNGTDLDIENGNYRLVYTDSWKLVDKTATTSYNVVSYTTGGTTYFVSASGLASGSAPNYTTNIDEAAVFSRNDNGGYTYLRISSGGFNSYLYLTHLRGTGNGSVIMYRDRTYNNSNRFSFLLDSNNHIRSRYNFSDSTGYYLTYNNGWAVTTIAANSASFPSSIANNTFHLDALGDAVSAAASSGDLKSSTSTGKKVFYESDTTYIPLNVAQDGGDIENNHFAEYVADGNYDPTFKNTGYIVPGSLITDNQTNLNQTNASSMRVSKYEISKINNSYTSGSSTLDDSKVMTVCGSDNNYEVKSIKSRIDNDGINYARYGSSKSKFLQILQKDRTYVSGLHFADNVGGTNSTFNISMNNIVRVKNAYINGNTYPDGYDLPVYSINFNLKKAGYVNFFAGNYTGGHPDSMFSLHQIFREGTDRTKITSIKEISGVYKNKTTDECIYRYGNSGSYTYSVGTSAPSSTTYSLVFDKGWLGINGLYNKTTTSGGRTTYVNENYIFYFEIPMNAGEFCLGNVPTGDGGYLLYLDIGANGAQVLHGITAYSITTQRLGNVYPAGVDFLVVGVDKHDAGGYSFGLSINKGNATSGSVAFNISANHVVLTDGLSTTYSYQGTKWKSTQPSDTSYFYVSGSSPGALPVKPGGERVSFITITESSGVYNVKIVDTLDENGSMIGSAYYFKNSTDTDYGDPISLETLQTTAASSILQDNVLNLIRSLRTVVTISSDLTNGYHEFTSQPAYSPDSGANAYKIVNVVVSGESGHKVTVSFVLSGYTISINGSSASLNSSFTLP